MQQTIRFRISLVALLLFFPAGFGHAIQELHPEDPELTRIIGQLSDPDEEVRRRAANALYRKKDPAAVKALIRALGDESMVVARVAASGLIELKSDDTLRQIVNAFQDRNPQVRRFAVSVAGKLGREAVVDRMIGMLEDKVAEVRSAAAKELGQIGDPRALTPLINALADQDTQVRLQAAWSLGDLDDPRVTPLLKRLQDPDLRVRIAASETLANIAGSPASFDLDMNIVQRTVDALSPKELIRGGEFVIFGPEGRPGGGVGRGQCPLCHVFSAGESAERAPNLFGATNRAAARVKEFRYQQADFVKKESFSGSGRATTAVEYLAESKVCPGCYVVEGFGVKGSLDRESPDPAFHKPPMNLTITDMLMVDAWLFANDGKQPPPAATMRAAYERFIPEDERTPGRLQASQRGITTISTGDDEPSAMIAKMGCAMCHKIPRVAATFGLIGPVLIQKTDAAHRVESVEYQQRVTAGKGRATTPREYVIESIVNPDAFITPRYVQADKPETSMMPQDYGRRFTYQAIEKLADFLLTLDQQAAVEEGLIESSRAE